MKKLFFGTLCVLFTLAQESTHGQQRAKVVLAEADWSDGTLTMTDGKVIHGDVRYNEHTGSLSFRNGSDTLTFTSNSIRAFVLRDTIPHREFISLEFVTAAYNGKRTLFFEKIREYPEFAILSRTEPYIAYRGEGLDMPDARNTQVYEVFSFYLVKKDGTIIPFIRQLSGYQFSAQSSRNSRINMNFFYEKEVLENQIGKDQYRILNAYAKEKKLSFKVKSDFLLILKHYDQLRTE